MKIEPWLLELFFATDMHTHMQVSPPTPTDRHHMYTHTHTYKRTHTHARTFPPQNMKVQVNSFASCSLSLFVMSVLMILSDVELKGANS